MSEQTLTTTGRPASAFPIVAVAAMVPAGVVLAIGIAELTVSERYLLAIAATMVLPFGAALYRRPVAVLALWLLFAPLVMLSGDSGGVRHIYWLVHRALPLAALGATLLAPWLGTAVRRLPRLGLPELFLAGYVVASLISILAVSPDPLSDTYVLYDRVVVPTILYLIVRLNAPDERTIDRWFPVLAVLVLSQAAIGIASWVAPDVLPDAWLNRAGSRTTGSLRHPNVYGITMLFAGALALHIGQAAPRGSLRRVASVPLLALGATMAFLTLSRATWLAAILLLLGLAWMYPRAFAKVLAVATIGVMLVLASGTIGIDTEGVSERLYSSSSEESALSRLPVVVASIRMVEQKPVVGWGYNRFDEHDQDFQESIDGLYVPSKDHASHNLHLTILAEQGFVGLSLYLGPAAVLLFRTRRIRPYLRSHPRARHQVATLWLVLGGHLVVTNFSNMKVPFGLGIWWICLGLIAVIIDQATSPDDPGDEVQESKATTTGGWSP